MAGYKKPKKLPIILTKNNFIRQKMTKLSKSKVMIAIKDSMGIQAIIAKKCDVARQTISNYLLRPENKDLVLAVDQERERVIDVAEGKLLELVNEKNFNAIQFLLKTKGSHRGYVEKTINLNANVTANLSAEDIAEIINERQSNSGSQDSLEE